MHHFSLKDIPGRASWNLAESSVQTWVMWLGQKSLLRHRPLPALAVSTVLVALALGARFASGELLVGLPFLSLLLVVIASSFVGGWAVGLFAMVLGALGAHYFLMPSDPHFSADGRTAAMALNGYLLTSLVVVALSHTAVTVAEASIALAGQRQLLLVELQHRIKNHLQLIGAILTTHARSSGNEEIRNGLDEAGRRLLTIAQAYDNSFLPGALVDMADHLREVSGLVERGVGTGKTRITVNAVSTRWPVERAIPLSLITHELLTNAIKHSPGDGVLIDVSLRQCGSMMRLSVHSREMKLPAGFDTAKSGFGLGIASMLASQLGGVLTTPSFPDALFIVEFPASAGDASSRGARLAPLTVGQRS